ncbi:MAG: hypothetical protein J0I52_08240 [Bordetella sp.]|nr:hypothetical protein [Bordetella sp.]
MTENSEKISAAEALKRALAAKQAASRNTGAFGGPAGAVASEKSMQRQSVALNKPAFRRASKRG